MKFNIDQGNASIHATSPINRTSCTNKIKFNNQRSRNWRKL